MLARQIVRSLRRVVSVRRRAALVARFLPPSRWYDAAVLLARAQWAGIRLLRWRPDISLRNAVYLDTLLFELMPHGNFPIRWRVVGAEHLRRKDGEGVLFCSSHLPLFGVIARVLSELDIDLELVIALESAIGPDGRYPVPGLDVRVPALPPGAKSLVRLKRVLLKGGVVASLIDEYPGGPLKPQLLRLAGRLGTRVVYVFTELDDNNVVTFTAAVPPFPGCATEEEIAANLAAYDAERQRILRPFHGSDRSAQPRPA